jgi:hypothetical protein
MGKKKREKEEGKIKKKQGAGQEQRSEIRNSTM